jgi:hypothetical protein
MSEAVMAPLAAWQNFYVIIGTAATTLTGLLFVVITLVSGALGRVTSPWSGILLPISAALALFVIAAGTLLLVIMGIRNAWDVVTYMVIEVPQSQYKSQD